MSRIERIAVVANRMAIAALVDRPNALMAIAAEGAQRPEHEGVVIAFMRRVMVSDRRRRRPAGLEAHGAERGVRKLMLGAPSPALKRIPGAPVKRACRVKVASVHSG